MCGPQLSFSTGGGALAFSATAPLQSRSHAAGAHIALAGQAELRLFELLGDFSLGQTGGEDDDVQSASAGFCLYRKADNAYDLDAAAPPVELYDVLTRRDDAQAPAGPPPFKQGQRAWGLFNEQSGRWELLHQPPGVWRFELTESLSPGGEADAVLVAWDDGAADYVATGVALRVHDAFGLWGGAAGERAYARYFADSDRWEVVPQAASGGALVRFELSAAKAPVDAAALGKLVAWNGSAYQAQGSDVAIVQSIGQWAGAIGYRGWAVARADRPTHDVDQTTYPAYEIVWMEGLARWIEFTLTEDMGEQTAGQATATVDDAYHGFLPGSSVTVYDPQSAFGRALDGAKGAAALDDVSEEYHVIRCEQQAAMCRGLIKGAMSSANSTHTVDNVTPLVGQSPVASSGETITVDNVFHWDADDNAACVFAWDEPGGKWILLQVECPA